MANYFKSSKSLFALIVLSLASTFLSAATAGAATVANTSPDNYVTLYGPVRTFAPLAGTKTLTATFNVAPAPSSGELLVTNGTGEDLSQKSCAGLGLIARLICVATNAVNSVRLNIERPTSVEISLNGVVVVAPSALPKTVNSLNVPLNLLTTNQLTLKIKGSIFSSVTIKVRGLDHTPPVILVTAPNEGQIFESLSMEVSGTSNKVLVSVKAQLGTEPAVALSLTNGGLGFSGIVTTTSNGSKALKITASDLAGNETIVTRNVTLRVNHPPQADLRLATASIGVAPFIVLFNAGNSSDIDGDALSYTFDWGDGETTVSQTPRISHEFKTAGTYAVSLTVKDPGGLSSQAEVSVTANLPAVSPNPETVAPPLAQKEQTPFLEATSFIYQGSNPIQKDVVATVFVKDLVSVAQGKILDGDGLPIAGAKVTVLGRTEYGYTLSREDGAFTIALNAGGLNILNIERNGYTSVSRQLQTSLQTYYPVDEIRMTRLDPKVTTVQINSPIAQVVQGSLAEDSAGPRTATLVIPKQTTAQMRFPSGTVQSLSSLNIRLTEFTVGPNGQAKMPATLPPRTAYTYAVDLSADEAIASGASSIEFSKPVAFYVDNFLGITVGGAVPLGYLNRTTGFWEPQNDGIVMQVLSIDAGIPALDLGEGRAATSTELASFGIDSDELQKIASLYPAGRSIWRVQMNHFSAWDLNFQRGPSSSIVAVANAVRDSIPEEKKVICPGCQVSILNQEMREQIALPGTPFYLGYSSAKSGTRGAGSSIHIPLTGLNPIPNCISIRTIVQIAGRNFLENRSCSEMGQALDFTWDGNDFAGRPVTGFQYAYVVISYIYQDALAVQRFNSSDPQTFSTYNKGVTIQTMPGQGTYSLDTVKTIPLIPPTDLATKLALDEVGRWTISAHHFYDTELKQISFGDGSSRRLSDLPKIVRHVAGAPTAGFSGDGGLAATAQLNLPRNLILDNQGNILFTDIGNQRVRKIDRVTGIITTIAGTGVAGFSGDGGPAVNARLNQPAFLAVDIRDNIFVSDYINNRVRKIDSAGIITTIAGTGVAGYSGDGGPAVAAELSGPRGVTYTNDGSLYISEENNNVVRRIDVLGRISTVAGTGVRGKTPDGGQAIDANLSFPNYTAFDRSNNMYITESGNCLVRMVSPTGVLSTVAGTGECGYDGSLEGTQAKNQKIGGVASIRIGPDGTLYVADRDNNRIRSIDGAGQMSTLAGTGLAAFNGDSQTGRMTNLNFPTDVAIRPDGTVIWIDRNSSSIRSFTDVRPLSSTVAGSPGTFEIPSSDGGEIYVFDIKGRHLLTRFGLTGTTKYTFEYDLNNLLSAIVDADGNRTSIDRDGSGTPSGITTPYGQRFAIELDSRGGLSKLTMPTGEAYSLSYNSLGLMGQFTKPNGNAEIYEYNTFGYLQKVTNAAGGFSRYDRLVGNKVQRLSREGAKFTASYDVDAHANSVSILSQGDWNSKSVDFAAGGTTKTGSDGVVQYLNSNLDTRSRGFSTFNSASQTYYPEGGNESYSSSRVYTSNSFYDFAMMQTDIEPTRTRTTAFDSTSKTFVFSSNGGQSGSMTLDSKERPVSVQIGGDLANEISYDDRGRISVLQRGSRRTEMTYASNGTLLQMRDPIGRVSSVTYDNSGKLLISQNPASETIRYGYDPNGNLLQLLLPNGLTHSFAMTVLDLFQSYTTPDGNRLTRSYDFDKNLTNLLRADGKSIALSYEANEFRRVSQVQSESQSVDYTYSPGKNKLRSVITSDGSQIIYDYNGYLSRAKTYSGPFSSVVSIGYSNPGMLPTSQSVGISTAGYVFNSDLLLIGAGGMTIARDNSTGRPLIADLGIIRRSFGYSAYGELSSLTESTAGYYFNETLLRDDLGRIVSTKNSQTLDQTDYRYDLAGRLSKVTRTGARATIVEYAYDSQGNRTSTTRDGVVTSATFDREDRLTAFGDLRFSYTLAGELSSRTNLSTGETTVYKYDQQGQLLRVDLSGGGVVEYQIDGEGKRLARKVNGVLDRYFVHDFGGRLVGEVDSSGNVISHFIYALDAHSPDLMVRGSVEYKFVKDHLGSVTAVINSATGAVLQQISYDEFGVVLSDSNPSFQPFGFAGGQFDSLTKLVRFGARDYDAETGRWTAKDPILFGGGDTNLFGYVANDPVNLTDSSGLEHDRTGAPVKEENLGPGNGYGTGGGSGGRGPYNPNQGSLIDLAKQANSRGGLSFENARTLIDWANEYGLKGRIDSGHKGTNTDFPHLHIGPVNHVPICE